MINPLNKNIDLKALEERLADELEERIEFGCWVGNACGCDSGCNHVPVCGCDSGCGVGNVPICSGGNVSC